MIATRILYRGISLAGIAALAAIPLFAGHKNPEPMAKQSPEPRGSDTQFVKDAAEGGRAEVKLGQLAEQLGSAQNVKAFGKRMVSDHGTANDQLEYVATRENISLPTTMDARDLTVYNELSKLKGAEFDRAYARTMVRDHEKDVAEFKKEADSGADSSVKNFAAKTLPALEEHLKMARDMMRQTSGTNGSTGH